MQNISLVPQKKSLLENHVKLKTAAFIRRKSPGNYILQQKDYGDDMKEFQTKNNEVNDG